MIKNLLLVTLDCARADIAYGGSLPNLDRLRKCGITCTHTISSSPLTPISHATVLSGRQPHHHGLRHLLREPVVKNQTLLAEHLRQHGFQTGAIVSCIALSPWYGLDRGFETYNAAVEPYQGFPLKRAPIVAEQSIRWIKNCRPDKPWFNFIHFFDAHWPYFSDEKIDNAPNSYEASLKYIDHHLGKIVDNLKNHGLLDETLIVVFGDHGEDLSGEYPNDKGGESLGHPEENGHGCLLYETTQHVPLVFSNPSFEALQYDRLVGLVDIAPTICGLLRLSSMYPSDGIDLSTFFYNQVQPSQRILYAETLYPSTVSEQQPDLGELPNLQAIWLDPTTKVIRHWRDEGSMEVFDLQKDPYELHPLSLSAITDLDLSFNWPSLPSQASSIQ